ncbi:MAG: hypothetical protein ABEJ79_11570 [Halolamina sp.]
MTELDDAVERFLDDVDDVYEEYDQGYMDADAALTRVEDHLRDLREAARE